MRKMLGFLVAIAMNLMTIPAEAGTPALPAGGPTVSTDAHRAYCQSLPVDCRVNLREPAVIVLTEDLSSLVRKVNRKVNRLIKPITDQAHWGVVDRWDLPTDGYGDCEDYQLLKRQWLVRAGIPRRALPMAVVQDPDGQGHAVLMLRTDRGDFILDNLNDHVVRWDQTPYVWIKRENQNAPGWVSLGWVVASPLTGSAPAANPE